MDPYIESQGVNEIGGKAMNVNRKWLTKAMLLPLVAVPTQTVAGVSVRASKETVSTVLVSLSHTDQSGGPALQGNNTVMIEDTVRPLPGCEQVGKENREWAEAWFRTGSCLG